MGAGRFIKKAMAVCLAFTISSGTIVYAGEISEEAASLLSTAVTLADNDLATNKGTIQILLQTCLDSAEGNALLESVVGSVVILLENENADSTSVVALLSSLLPTKEDGSADAGDIPIENPTEQGSDSGTVQYAESGLPIFQVSSFIKKILSDVVLIDVPGDWGNNGPDRVLTTYSPINDSGAISPAAGTLSISYFPMEEAEAEAAFDSYVKNISDMSVVAEVTSEDTTAADLPARRLDFIMNVGANQYTCETICFAYDSTIFSIELMQGQQTEYDYFNVYDQVVDSAEIGNEADIQMLQENDDAEDVKDAEDAEDNRGEITHNEVALQPEKSNLESHDFGTVDINSALPSDMGTFMYELAGEVYQFPTNIMDLDPEALRLDRTLQLPYDLNSDADMTEGTWTELVNTQLYYFENSLHKEMAGVTNLSGYPVPMTEGVLTALIDTQGSYIDIVLPGGIRVGSKEEEIVRGFPEFSGRALDGLAGFRENELLYACNVRDDGCHGYVLIRNDDPYYSAVSIICDAGIVKEISFECIGAARATGVFL